MKNMTAMRMMKIVMIISITIKMMRNAHPFLPPAVERLASLHQEGDAIPSCIIDENGGSCKGRSEAVLRHSGIISVSWISSSAL